MKYSYLYVLKIEGMRCGACEAHVNDLIRRNFVVLKVKSSHLFKKTKIYTNFELDTDKLKTFIENEGYAIKDISKEVHKCYSN